MSGGRLQARQWAIPGGGTPDVGKVTANGTQLWLSGRNDRSVYVLSTADGHLIGKIDVGKGPHGLCAWPQPGRYSLGHTGPVHVRLPVAAGVQGEVPSAGSGEDPHDVGAPRISRVRSAGGAARLTLAGVVVSLVQIGRVADAGGRLRRYLRSGLTRCGASDECR